MRYPMSAMAYFALVLGSAAPLRQPNLPPRKNPCRSAVLDRSRRLYREHGSFSGSGRDTETMTRRNRKTVSSVLR